MRSRLLVDAWMFGFSRGSLIIGSPRGSILATARWSDAIGTFQWCMFDDVSVHGSISGTDWAPILILYLGRRE